MLSKQELLTKAKLIKLLILDVDGTLTDGNLYYSSEAIEFKAFNTQDGQGIKLLQQSGVEVAIITVRTSALLEKRAKDLGINYLFQGQNNKLVIYENLIKRLNFSPEQVAYVGDDLPDLAIIRRVGLGIAVANAYSFVKKHALYETKALGGSGAVREVCDLIMTAQGSLEKILAQYL